MQKEFVSSDGVRLAYQLDGECDAMIPILLLNGLFSDMNFWGNFVEAFAERLCIRMDHRGIGLSERWVGAYSYGHLYLFPCGYKNGKNVLNILLVSFRSFFPFFIALHIFVRIRFKVNS